MNNDSELKKIELLEEQVNIALKRSRQVEEFDDNFFKQELKEIQDKCQQNQQTMMRIEQKYIKTLSDTASICHTKESPMKKSKILKQSGLLESKNHTIQELQKRIFDLERMHQQRQTEDQMRIDQLENENQRLRDQFNQTETLDVQRELDELQQQYLELQQKLQQTLRQDDYMQLKQEFDEYQQLTQNIVNQEEEYQRRICELEEELQQQQQFQQEFLQRLKQNDDVFQMRYRELKQKYQQQLDDQRRILDQQIDDLRDQNNYLFSQLQNVEFSKSQLEFEQQKKQKIKQQTENDVVVNRSKSFSACGQTLQKPLYDQDQNKKAPLPTYYLNCVQSNLVQPSSKSKQSGGIIFNNNKPVKQINLSIEKENQNFRSFSKEGQVTYKQLTEQRFYGKAPKPKKV